MFNRISKFTFLLFIKQYELNDELKRDTKQPIKIIFFQSIILFNLNEIFVLNKLNSSKPKKIDDVLIKDKISECIIGSLFKNMYVKHCDKNIGISIRRPKTQ